VPSSVAEALIKKALQPKTRQNKRPLATFNVSAELGLAARPR
jgi:hypothetical protein